PAGGCAVQGRGLQGARAGVSANRAELRAAPNERLLPMCAKTELEPERSVGVGIPAHAKWQVHVLAHVELRDDRSEAVTDADGNAAVALVGRERTRRHTRRGGSIGRHGESTAP